MIDSNIEVVSLEEKLALAQSRIAARDERIALISQRVIDACDSAVNLRGSDADWILAPGPEKREVA